MKQFDEWYDNEFNEWDGNYVKGMERILEEAFRAGMLAAADMVDSYSDTLGGKPLYDIAGEISSDIRDACKDEG